MQVNKEIRDQIIQVVEDHDCLVVDISIMGGDLKTLQLMVERNDFTTVQIKDCSNISKKVSKLLDTQEVEERYFLEVSSPGIDRKIKDVKDYIRFQGTKIAVYLKESNTKPRGVLQGMEGENILIAGAVGDIVKISLADVKYSRVIPEEIKSNKDKKREKV